jgi:hypothetical protein
MTTILANSKKGKQMQKETCLICKTEENLVTEENRTKYRLDGFVGIDFYPAICENCFTIEKARR